MKRSSACTLLTLVFVPFHAIILGIFCHSEPEMLVGEWYGSHIRNMRSLGKIFLFADYLDPASVHPQLFVLDHVMAQAADGDLGATLHAIDEFAWAGNMLINVGDVKGKLVRDTARQVVAERLAAFFEAAGSGFSHEGEEENKRELRIRLVEFGTFLGYGTMQMVAGIREAVAAFSRTNMGMNNYVVPLPAVSISIETVDPSPLSHAASTALLQHAGVLGNAKPCFPAHDPNENPAPAAANLGACTVTVRVRKKRSTDIMEEYEQQGLSMDLLFIDHVKKLYLPDLKRAVKTGVLGAKAVVIADNMLMPPPPLLGFTSWVTDHSETVARHELDDDRSDFEAIRQKHAHTQSVFVKAIRAAALVWSQVLLLWMRLRGGEDASSHVVARTSTTTRTPDEAETIFGQTIIYRSHAEYWPNFPDEVLITRVKGK